jgi:hypothetical protein
MAGFGYSGSVGSGYGPAGGSIETSTPDYGLLNLLPQLNQQQANYPALGVPGYAGLSASESGNIASLLHPTDFSDQQRQGAEQAVAGGFAGSQFGDINTLHLTENERLRRQLLGSQMLSNAVGRLPGPVNPAALMGRTQTESRTIPTGPGGVTYTNIPGAPGSRGGASAGPVPTNPQTPMVLPGRAPAVNPFMSMMNPGGGAIDPISAWRTSIGLGAPDLSLNPYTGYHDYNTELNPATGQHEAVDQFGEPIDYNPVFGQPEDTGGYNPYGEPIDYSPVYGGDYSEEDYG